MSMTSSPTPRENTSTVRAHEDSPNASHTDEAARLHTDNDRWENGVYYNWRTYFPHDGGLLSSLRWLQSGYGGDKPGETDEELQRNLRHLATMIKLLREYLSLYGMPDRGGPKDQEYVLREVVTDLYEGGVPIWTLEPAMERAAEGLTGRKGIQFCIFPRTAFMFAPSSGATVMFRVAREFDIHRLTGAERILVRMASYASNTHGVASLPSRVPKASDLEIAAQQAALTVPEASREGMAAKILELASTAEGLFFFVNSKDRPEATAELASNDADRDRNHNVINNADGTQPFWMVERSISELFSRLATIEALNMIAALGRRVRQKQYSVQFLLLFRFVASAAACVVWFHGGWIDCLVAGGCGCLVGLISFWTQLTKEESMIFEGFASLLVGFLAGTVALLLPSRTCFGAMGVAGIIEILQGFRVVYAVLELMSKHSVSGSADFIEGLLYTGLIAYCLKVGQLVAIYVTSIPTTDEYITCNESIDAKWKLLLVPAAAVAWSGLFNPDKQDLPWMAFHGVLAFAITWACRRGNHADSVTLFIAALGVTFSSGMVSRFTGRQAMGNTVAGLYVLVPGAFLVESLFADISFNFMGPVVLNAAIIGTGAWAGTLLCSPTILGTTSALLKKRNHRGTDGERSPMQSDHLAHENAIGTMLFF